MEKKFTKDNTREGTMITKKQNIKYGETIKRLEQLKAMFTENSHERFSIEIAIAVLDKAWAERYP